MSLSKENTSLPFNCAHCSRAILRSETPEIKCRGCGSRIFIPPDDDKSRILRIAGKSLSVTGNNKPTRWGHHPFQHESFYNPLLREFQETFDFKKSFKGNVNEFQALVNLRHLCRNRWFQKRPSAAFLKKYGFWTCNRHNRDWYCTHQSRMFVMAAASLGIPARIVNVARGVKLHENHMGHMVSDIWCNKLQKWVYFDNLFDFHYENSDGEPLSLLEARNLFCRKPRKGLYLSTLRDFKGVKPGIYNLASENPDEMTKNFIEKSNNMFWCIFYHGNNYFSMPIENRQIRLLLFDDELTRGRKIVGNGKEHYAEEPMLFRTNSVHDVYPTMNNAEIQLYFKGLCMENSICVYIATHTPDIEYISYRLNGGIWRTCKIDGFTIPATRKTLIEAVTRNRFGAQGAISCVEIRPTPVRQGSDPAY